MMTTTTFTDLATRLATALQPYSRQEPAVYEYLCLQLQPEAFTSLDHVPFERNRSGPGVHLHIERDAEADIPALLHLKPEILESIRPILLCFRLEGVV
jgi:hypothetical protein